MEFRYLLTDSLYTKTLFIEKEKYEQLIKYRSKLNHALYIEEKYDTFISNYILIEKLVLNNTIDHFFYREKPYTKSHEFRLSLNKLFGNFLSSIRAYRDQVVGHVDKIMDSDCDAKTKCERFFSIEYDNFFEYQFMEALRNHSQHGGHPVHEVSINAKHAVNRNQPVNEFTILVRAFSSLLSENTKFKKTILERADEKTDLIKYSRQYIQCLNTCHLQIREMISEETNTARNEIESCLSHFDSIEPKNKKKRLSY